MRGRTRARFGLYFIFWSVLTIFFCIYFLMQLLKYGKLNDEAKLVSEQVERERLKSVELTEEIAYHGSDEFIEKIARERLGFVKPGEILFYTDSTGE